MEENLEDYLDYISFYSEEIENDDKLVESISIKIFKTDGRDESYEEKDYGIYLERSAIISSEKFDEMIKKIRNNGLFEWDDSYEDYPKTFKTETSYQIDYIIEDMEGHKQGAGRPPKTYNNIKNIVLDFSK